MPEDHALALLLSTLCNLLFTTSQHLQFALVQLEEDERIYDNFFWDD